MNHAFTGISKIYHPKASQEHFLMPSSRSFIALVLKFRIQVNSKIISTHNGKLKSKFVCLLFLV